VDVGHRDNTESAESEEALATLTSAAELKGSPAQWLRTTNYSPGVIAFVRRARRLLPGDPEFVDPLSTAGESRRRHAGRVDRPRGRQIGRSGRLPAAHAGRYPHRSAADWLGVDVNIAARVMERATKGGIMMSGATLDLIPQGELGRSVWSPNVHVNPFL
jgi:hypothetical protein